MVKVKSSKSSEKSINISKGIILTFFTIYLIIYGFGISIFFTEFQENNPGLLPLYVSYVPLVCYVAAAFTGMRLLIFIRNTRAQKTREVKSRKKIKAGSVYKQSLFVVIFIFSFIPLMAPIIDQGENDHNFSVYNDEWNGSSDLKAMLEDEGYDCYNIQSSLSTTDRVDRPILLILLGTNQYYNPINEIPYFIKFFEEGNSLLLAHDHGSTDKLLLEIFIANLLSENIEDKVPITLFPDGLLRDNQSCLEKGGLKDPSYPIIKDFTDHPINSGIDKVLLSQSTAVLGGPFVEFSGWDVLGSTSDYGFVDMNDDEEFDFEDDSYDLEEIIDVIDDFPDEITKIPLGGIKQTVFMSKEAEDARIFVSADASLFNNELLNEDGYDNQQFALNIIKWLTHEEDDWMIVFDEAHIRPEKSRDLTSAGIFGIIIQYVVHLSTNPITAWIYPLLAVYTLRKYLPKKDEKEQKKKAKEEELKEEKIRFRTSSFFAKKIEWYREKSKYDKALTLLYRRLERKLNTLLGGHQITTNNVVNMVISKDPGIPKYRVRRIDKFMDKIISIKSGKRKVKNEQEFEELFFEMEWVSNNL